MRTMIALALGVLVIAACVAPLTAPEQAPPLDTVTPTATTAVESAPEAAAGAAATPTANAEAEGDAEAAASPALADYLANCPICDTATMDYAGPLSAPEVQGLLLALNDEYHAIAAYTAVMEDYGEVRPFVNIRRAEYNHADALTRLFEAYSVPLPDNPWLGQVEGFASLQDACNTGVAAEIANRDLYTLLFASTERADIHRVYTALQSASEQNHLSAFQRCAGL